MVITITSRPIVRAPARDSRSELRRTARARQRRSFARQGQVASSDVPRRIEVPDDGGGRGVVEGVRDEPVRVAAGVDMVMPTTTTPTVVPAAAPSRRVGVVSTPVGALRTGVEVARERLARPVPTRGRVVAMDAGRRVERLVGIEPGSLPRIDVGRGIEEGRAAFRSGARTVALGPGAGEFDRGEINVRPSGSVVSSVVERRALGSAERRLLSGIETRRERELELVRLQRAETNPIVGGLRQFEIGTLQLGQSVQRFELGARRQIAERPEQLAVTTGVGFGAGAVFGAAASVPAIASVGSRVAPFARPVLGAVGVGVVGEGFLRGPEAGGRRVVDVSAGVVGFGLGRPVGAAAVERVSRPFRVAGQQRAFDAFVGRETGRPFSPVLVGRPGETQATLVGPRLISPQAARQARVEAIRRGFPRGVIPQEDVRALSGPPGTERSFFPSELSTLTSRGQVQRAIRSRVTIVPVGPPRGRPDLLPGQTTLFGRPVGAARPSLTGPVSGRGARVIPGGNVGVVSPRGQSTVGQVGRGSGQLFTPRERIRLDQFGGVPVGGQQVASNVASRVLLRPRASDVLGGLFGLFGSQSRGQVAGLTGQVVGPTVRQRPGLTTSALLSPISRVDSVQRTRVVPDVLPRSIPRVSGRSLTSQQSAQSLVGEGAGAGGVVTPAPSPAAEGVGGAGAAGFVFPFGGLLGGRRRRTRKGTPRQLRFTPSLVGISLNIRGPAPKRLTGFEVRPLPVRGRRRARRRTNRL